MVKGNLLKDIKFIIELDKMKSIERQTTLIDGSRRENDAEHSWHVATMAMVLHEYSNEKVDLFKVLKMLLVHDLVEIYAGDTFCYDEKGNLDKKEREEKAAEKIFSILPEEKGQEFKRLWIEFEAMETKEALFAASIDRLQPILSNYFSGGGTWKKFGISKSQVHKRVEPIKKSSQELWDLTLKLIDDAVDKGYIPKD